MLAAAILFTIASIGCFLLFLRACAVDAFLTDVRTRLYKAIAGDIAVGQDGLWRLERFYAQLRYPLLVLMFWKPLDSFVTDDSFLK